jgi:bifunctional polynucleotide phosphatase/kinase
LKADSTGPKAKLPAFKAKATAVLKQLNLPINIYAATEKDIFRKPRTGMWTALLEDHDIKNSGELDLENSIFVGDAAGRNAGNGTPKDFSCSDR